MTAAGKTYIHALIEFDELVEHGRQNGGNIVNGMPWSFTYEGHPVTHETDTCYLISTPQETLRLRPGDCLLTGFDGTLSVQEPQHA